MFGPGLAEGAMTDQDLQRKVLVLEGAVAARDPGENCGSLAPERSARVPAY